MLFSWRDWVFFPLVSTPFVHFPKLWSTRVTLLVTDIPKLCQKIWSVFVEVLWHCIGFTPEYAIESTSSERQTLWMGVISLKQEKAEDKGGKKDIDKGPLWFSHWQRTFEDQMVSVRGSTPIYFPILQMLCMWPLRVQFLCSYHGPSAPYNTWERRLRFQELMNDLLQNSFVSSRACKIQKQNFSPPHGNSIKLILGHGRVQQKIFCLFFSLSHFFLLLQKASSFKDNHLPWSVTFLGKHTVLVNNLLSWVGTVWLIKRFPWDWWFKWARKYYRLPLGQFKQPIKKMAGAKLYLYISYFINRFSYSWSCANLFYSGHCIY